MALKKKKKKKQSKVEALEEKIQFVRQYSKLWENLFSYFDDSLEDKQITQQQEDEFFKIMSVLANRHFELTVRLEGELPRPDRFIAFLGELVSLSTLQALSEAEFSTRQVRWHELFIDLNKALGKLVQQLPVQPGAASPAAGKLPEAKAQQGQQQPAAQPQPQPAQKTS